MIQLIGDYTRQNNRMNSDWVNGATEGRAVYPAGYAERSVKKDAT